MATPPATSSVAPGPTGPVTPEPTEPPAVDTTEPLPACRYRDLRTIFRADDDWAITLLDPVFSLAPGYVPDRLVPVSRAGLGSGELIRPEVISDLRDMARAARADGAAIAVRAGYRSFAQQAATFAQWRAQWGYDRALEISARAGHSEHQLGTAIDIRSADSYRAPWEYVDWGRTDPGRWMRLNSWRFGFILSYPREFQDETCYDYEPWHFRYVGVALAAQIHASGHSPRRYLWEHYEAAARFAP